MIEFLPIELAVRGATLVPSSRSPCAARATQSQAGNGAHPVSPYPALCRTAGAALEFSRFSNAIA